MKRVLEGLEPQKVFYFFEEISKIPRGSFNEKAVSDWIVNFARERGLSVTQDESWNVVIPRDTRIRKRSSFRGIWIWYAKSCRR